MSGIAPETRSIQRCTISIHPRLHVTLIGMTNEGYRRNGGVGFSVQDPCATVTVSAAASPSLRDNRRHPLQSQEQLRLMDAVSRFSTRPVGIEISGDMPSHFGFGSATAIRLAALEGASVIAGQPAARESLVRGSKRGGTSGIGITTYFTGGFVLDLGVKQAPLEILPSSALEGARPDPLVIMRIDMPDWGVGICIPSGIRALSEVEEIEFFRRACPVPRPDVNETLYHVIYGLAASALERDLGTFSQAIKEIQGCTWKSLERVLHGDRLLALERDIYEAGAAAVGMSSLGPCLFFLGGDLGRLADSLSEKRPEHLWLTTAICNSSRSLTAA